MTPPPPKTYFPVAETKPPSTPYLTNLQLPQIIIRFEPSLAIQIMTHQPNNVEKPYLATPSSITITVMTTPLNIVGKPSCLDQPQKYTISIVQETPTPVKPVEKASPQLPTTTHMQLRLPP